VRDATGSYALYLPIETSFSRRKDVTDTGRSYRERMSTSRPKHLPLAAALAGAGGLALVVVGWWVVGWEYRGDWGRLADLSWWASGIGHGLKLLALGKVGLKIAVACVAGVAAVVAWRRRRRQSRTTELD
jgi:hypothetical protein